MTNTTITRSPERIEFLTDVLITAVEGGIGYWSQCSDYTWSAADAADRGVDLYIPADEIPADQIVLPVTADTYSVSAFAGGGEAPAHRVRVTLDSIASGIGRVTRGETGVASDYVGRIFAASMENDAGEIDSDDADVIVQAAVFGTVIYG